MIIETWGYSRNTNKVVASVLPDTESQHLLMTISLSSGKECLLTWLGGLHMNMINGSLNALTHNSGILTINTLRPRLAVDRIMLKVHSLVPAPSNIPSATDVQIHLQTLRLICLHGPNILLINSQHLIRCINSIQETLLISTSRASITLPNRNRSHS